VNKKLQDNKLEIEPIVTEITSDYTTQLLIQKELQDIYDCLDIINNNYKTIYLSDLERLEDKQEDSLINNNKFQEGINYENI
jgi:hypothetical protein